MKTVIKLSTPSIESVNDKFKVTWHVKCTSIQKNTYRIMSSLVRCVYSIQTIFCEPVLFKCQKNVIVPINWINNSPQVASLSLSFLAWFNLPRAKVLPMTANQLSTKFSFNLESISIHFISFITLGLTANIWNISVIPMFFWNQRSIQSEINHPVLTQVTGKVEVTTTVVNCLGNMRFRHFNFAWLSLVIRFVYLSIFSIDKHTSEPRGCI